MVWTDGRVGPHPDIYGARVTPQGSVLDLDGFVISQAAFDQSSPTLAFDGTNFLVAWVDGRTGDDYDIYGARVSLGGTMLDPDGFAISREVDWQWSPSAGFDGVNFLVVWTDERRSGGYGNIYGARVDVIRDGA